MKPINEEMNPCVWWWSFSRWIWHVEWNQSLQKGVRWHCVKDWWCAAAVEWAMKSLRTPAPAPLFYTYIPTPRPQRKGVGEEKRGDSIRRRGVRGIEKERGDGGGTARSRDVLCSTNTRKWLFKRWATSPPTAQWFLKSIRAVCADLRTRKLLRGDRSWGAITGSWSHIAQHPAGVCGGVCAYTPHHSTINPFRRNTCTGH